MDIKNVVIDSYATIGKNALLVGVSPAYAYEGGNKTDKVIGYKYEVVLPEKMYDKLTVKVLGDKKLDMPENETPLVLLDGLSLSLYWTPQGHKVSATAENIRLANPPKKV